MITGVVLARNEEANIVGCMQSLRPHCEEIILIDMGSADRTVELSEPYVCRVIPHDLIDGFDAARNAAVPFASYEWLWYLDADERIPPRTGSLVRSLISDCDASLSALWIPFKSHFAGKWIQHCGWWPGYTMPRVLRRGRFRFSERLHGGVEVAGEQGRLPPDPDLAIEHFSYRSIEHYVEKFNRYTSIEAAQAASAGVRLNWRAGMEAMARDLWTYYEGGGGQADGRHGWILSWLAGQYRWMSHAKLLDELPFEQKSDDADAPRDLDEAFDAIQEEFRRLRRNRPTFPLGVRWRSPIWDPSGYAQDARTSVVALASSDRVVSVESIDWSDRRVELRPSLRAALASAMRVPRPASYVAVTSCIPSLCEPDPQACYNVIRTLFETDRIPSQWLPRLDAFDEIWVHAHRNWEAFVRSGVAPEKLRIVPGGVDATVYREKGPTLNLPIAMKDRTVVLSVFDWQWRKGWDVLIDAYVRAFCPTDGVGLLLKVTRSHGHSLEHVVASVERVLATSGQRLRDRVDLSIIDKSLSDEEMAALYRSVDCFVLASRGEGWGLPLLEAMATGLPVIAVPGSGSDEFLTDANALLVRADAVDVGEDAAAELPIYRGHRWMEPQRDSLIDALRRVAADGELRFRLGKFARADVMRSFTTDHFSHRAETEFRRIESLLQGTPPSAEKSAVAVRWEGEFFVGHSFSNVNEAVCREWLRRGDVDLSVGEVRRNPVSPEAEHRGLDLVRSLGRRASRVPDVVVRHAFPPDWTPPEHGHWVHIQPWEFGSLPLDWVEPLRDAVDEIWAPSEYVRQVYVRSGIPLEKIHVIPWGVDEGWFSPEMPPTLLETEKTFRFLFLGGTIARKGFDVAWRAYVEEFSQSDDVCFVVKDVGVSSFYRYGNASDAIRRYVANGVGPEVLYIEDDRSPGQLASLCASCDCLAAPYRGEGFGLPILEAMACGVPPIAPNGGPAPEFVDESTGILLPCSEVVTDHDWRLAGAATEFAIDIDDLRRAMRWAYEHRDRVRSLGAAAAEKVRSAYTWRHTVAAMSQRIRALTASTDRPLRLAPRPRNASDITAIIWVDRSLQSLPDLLSRCAPFVDRAIVASASLDARSIAEEYGARFVSSRSAATALNAALRTSGSDWIVRLNEEDRPDISFWHAVRDALPALERSALGALISIHTDQVSYLDLRLIRNRAGVEYSSSGGGLLDSVRKAGGDVAFIDSAPLIALDLPPATLDDASGRRRDSDANYRYAVAALAEGDLFHAECFLRECLADASEPLLRRDVYAKLIVSYLQVEEPERADEARRAGAGEFAEDPLFERLPAYAPSERIFI